MASFTDPNIEFSVQKKAETLFGLFPYELEPTQDYLFTLYRFYSKEADLCKEFEKMQVNDIKNLADMIGFQNYHTCVQSKNFIKDWMERKFDLSKKDFDAKYTEWNDRGSPDTNAQTTIAEIENSAYAQIPIERSIVDKNIAKVFEHYEELRKVPEEWIEEPPHPVGFLHFRTECHHKIKKLRKSLLKTNHPLAPTFKDSIYGSYLFLIEETFPIELKKPYLNLCIIYAFRNAPESTRSTSNQKTN
jgi:hypothetical protein